MSTCNFSIPFSGEADTIIAKARSVIETQNGIFTGNAAAGDFEVTVLSNTVKGNYSVAGQVLNLTITNKPFFVPCSTIESLLRSKIS